MIFTESKTFKKASYQFRRQTEMIFVKIIKKHAFDNNVYCLDEIVYRHDRILIRTFRFACLMSLPHLRQVLKHTLQIY